MRIIKRRIVIFLSTVGVTVAAYGQGLVNFLNSPATLVSLSIPGSIVPVSIQWPPNSYYFGLLTGPMGATNLNQFSFSGVYGTNQAIIGRFSGGAGIAVSGWAPGSTRSFLVAGWSADLGHDFDQNWMNGDFTGGGYFGLSSIGVGRPGGFDGTSSIIPLNVFGGPDGLQTGFTLSPVGAVPEPFTSVLVVLGAATLMVWRQRTNYAAAA